MEFMLRHLVLFPQPGKPQNTGSRQIGLFPREDRGTIRPDERQERDLFLAFQFVPVSKAEAERNRERNRRMAGIDLNLTELRDRWVFRYKPVEVLAAAERLAKHHAERHQWWDKERQAAEAELKKKGFEYRERATSVGQDFQIVGDPELIRRLNQCKQKSHDHQEAQRLYEIWARALKARAERQPGEELELKINDIVFFGL
jgi:hypothetical protein